MNYRDLPRRSIPCPLCGGSAFLPLADDDRYAMGLATVGCESCGLILTNPRPTPEAMAAFYERDYRPLYRKLETPTEDYIRSLGLARRAAYTADCLAERRLVPPGGRVLDVGSAEGSLLRELGTRDPGLVKVGVEPGPGFAAFCRTYAACEVFPSVDAIALPPFDTVVAIHVLEHVDDPVAFLQRLAPLLRDDGALYLDVPDARRYSSLDDLHLAHLFHFTDDTLVRTLEKAGLHPEFLEAHRPPHHPPSLRCIARKTPAASRPKPARESAFERVKTACRRTWRYRARRWLFRLRASP